MRFKGLRHFRPPSTRAALPTTGNGSRFAYLSCCYRSHEYEIEEGDDASDGTALTGILARCVTCQWNR